MTAAHHFLLMAFPSGTPDSRAALDAFVKAASDCRFASADRDSVLVQLLAILQLHAGGRLPSSVDCYFVS